MAIRNPSPSAPRRLATGTRHPSKRTARVGCAFQPILRSLAPKERPGRVLLHHDGRDALRPRLAGADHADIEVAGARAGDELLFAGQDVMVAVALGACAQRRRVGAGARLGQAVARDGVHRREAGKKPRPLLVRAVGVDHPGAHVVDRQEGRDGRATLRQRLEDQGRLDPPEAGAAGFLANVDPRHAQRGGFTERADREILVSSHAIAWGAIWSAAKAAAMSRIAVRSSSRPNDMGGSSRSRNEARVDPFGKRPPRNGASYETHPVFASVSEGIQGCGTSRKRGAALNCFASLAKTKGIWRRPLSLPHGRDRELRAALDAARPALRDGLGLGVEADRIRPVLVQVAEARALPAAEGVVGDRNRIGTFTPTMPVFTRVVKSRAASPSWVKIATPLPYWCVEGRASASS